MTTRTAKDKGHQRDTGAERPSLTLSYYVTNGAIVTLLLVLLVCPVAADHTSPAGWGNLYTFYPNASYPSYNSLPGIYPGQTVTYYSDGSGIYGWSILYFDSGGNICYNGATNLGGAMSGTHTVITGSCNGTRLYFRANTGANPMTMMFAVGSNNGPTPTILTWVDPSTGPEPLYATIHFSMTGAPPPSLSWEIRDPDGTVKSTGSGTIESTTFTFNRAGTWTVYAWATNENGQAADTADVVVTSQELPPTVTPSPAYTLVPNVTYAPVAPGNVTTLATLATLATPSAPAVPGNITSGYVDTINDMRDMTNSFADSILGKLDIPFLMINGFFETVTQELAGIVTAFSGDAHAVLYLVTKTMNALPSGVKLLMSYALCGDLIVLLIRGET